MSADPGTREQLLAACLACVERVGLAKTSVEGVAREAARSRATVYRYFPAGRDQLVRETAQWEVDRFFARVEAEIAAEPDLAAKLARALAFGHQAITEHELLQRILRTEPEALLEELLPTVALIEQVMAAYLLDVLRSEAVRPEVDLAEAAGHLSRLLLSYLTSQGQWDLTDPASVDRLVRTQFLAAVLVAP